MEYQALYRKWRPSVFEDVIGQEPITDTLRNQVLRGKTAHAYLFTGSRGTGKTTCSKILAKAVNCLHPKDGDPCGECQNCRGIEDGSILDVAEIDAASNNGVDSIRQLREEANFTPVSAQYRVYIIDETHMLSIGAFNALLKILEEPPSHVLFILATTEIHKVPATILSRCQRFDFRRIQAEKIAARLEYIAGQEGVLLEPDAALLIARIADGGMRDALSLADVCFSNRGDGPVTLETVSQAAGLAGNLYLYQLAEAIRKQDTAAALQQLEELSQRSVEFERLCQQLLEHFRNLMIARTVDQPEGLVLALPEELAQLKQQAQAFRMPAVLSSMDILSQALGKMAKGSTKRLELEMALVKMCSPALNSGEAALLDRIQTLEDLVKSLGNRGGSKGEDKRPLESGQPVPEPSAVPPEQKDGGPKAERIPTEVVPLACWPEVLEQLSRTNPPLYGSLTDSRAFLTGDLVLIDAQKNSIFLDLMRKSEVTKKSLRDALFSCTGKRCRLGPYTDDSYQIVSHSDPLEKLIEHAVSQGVDVEIKE